nr:unnamed protein product [Spirometra erinaceieuropaei]
MRTLQQADAAMSEPPSVHNLSSKQLTDDQIKVLQHESGYNTGDAQPLDFIAALEATLAKTDTTEDSKNSIRQRVSSLIISHKPRRTISSAELKAIRELKMDEEIFDGKYYQQVNGTPMGSPISGLLVELVLQRLEQDVVRTFEPKMWFRYVDDTFVIIKTREVERLHQSLNSVFPAILFTREEATGDTLPFLDVSIQRLRDGKLATSVHRKDSSAEIILNYGSNHPAAHKRSCVRTLFHRAYRICNGDDSLKKELAYLHRLFRSNGYPASFVKNCLRRKRQLPNPESHEDRASQKFYSLPYIQGISEALSRQLKRFGISIAHKPASSLRETLCRVKDPVPKEQLTNVIYRIPCANCPCVYIGHTGRCLGTRINEYKLALRRRDPLSLVFAHAIEHDHRFNWDDTEVIAKANTRQAREFLEAWHSGTTSINRHVDLDAHYEGLRTRSLSCSHTSTFANPHSAT